MCGIVAKIGSGGLQPIDPSKLAHRGPDGQGTLHVTLERDAQRIHVALGATRLAILGGNDVQVPFMDEYTKIAVAYNGEIYNWRELRDELSVLDATSWTTECDVEVLTRAWRRWGPAALPRLNGMFAFVLVDRLRGEVFAVRDRAGEKPLYYHRAADGVISFASEIKALGVPLWEGSCPESNVFEFDCLRATPFAGVEALQPGTYMQVDTTAAAEVSPWWAAPATKWLRPSTPTYDVALDHATKLVLDAVRVRTCEGPLAILVSGGLDSAVLYAAAKELKREVRAYTYAADLNADDPYVDLAKLVAPDTTFVTFGREHVEEVFEEVAYYLDTPATWTAFAQYFLAKRIAVDGGKIILSGEGADEIFYGYARYKALWWLDQMHADPVLDGYGETIARVLGDDARHLVGRVLDRGFNDAPWTYADAYGGPATHSCVSRLARTEWHTTMQVLLRMLDRMTGRFGLEGRAPFLDHRLIEFVSPLPDEYKITKHETKRLLRDVARRLGVPKAITESTGKRGLSIPWNHWHGIKSWNRDHFADAMYGSWWRAFDLDSP